jgi:DNA mismatch repair protein MutS2
MLEKAIAETKDDGRAVGGSGGRKDLHVGDRVRTTGGVVGVVREVRPDGAIVLESGVLRVVTREEAITTVLEPTAVSTAGSQPTARPRPSGSPLGPVRPSADVVSEIKLLGLRVDEAEAELTQALDAAIQTDLPYLRIIHGKGTGALRELVHRVLAADPRVAHFALAPANQGGAGVTVVEFRA